MRQFYHADNRQKKSGRIGPLREDLERKNLSKTGYRFFSITTSINRASFYSPYISMSYIKQ